MLKKTSFLLCIYIALTVLDACKCPDEVILPFYDFAEITLSYEEGTVVEADKEFRMMLQDETFTYFANHSTAFSLISSTYATSPCPSSGDEGRKFAVIDIDFVSNADFDEAHPAGTSLKDVVEYGVFNQESRAYDFEFLKSITNEEIYNTIYHLQIAKRPTMTKEHIFTIEVTKDNGEKVVTESERIIWE